MSGAATCKCGHDRATHYDKADNCLAPRCECQVFSDVRERDTPVIPLHSYQRSFKRPHADPDCYCGPCMHWRLYGWVAA